MLNFEKLDKIIHEKWRLAIMALLASRRTWSFQELKAELKMSDGNLITHMRTLHKLGLISVTKEFHGRPQTTYGLTAKGGRAFQEHLNILEKMVKELKKR